MLVRAPRAVIAGVAALCALLVSGSTASAAPGELDPSFGSDGVVQVLASNEESSAKGVAVQPDDKIVLAGYEEPGNVVLLRLLPSGEPDPSFGTGGKVVTAFPGGFGEARAVAIQADGKIVVAGEATGTVNADFLFARYKPDGSPDPSFGGGDGVTTVPVGAGEDEAEAVAVGADGRIAAAGTAKAGAEYMGGVAVVLANGTPDASFAGDGTTTFETPPGNDRPDAVAVLADGRILVGDASGAGAGDGFSLVQLLPTSAPDPSFGAGDGIVLTPIPTEGQTTAAGRITDFARLGDGRIVASGYGFDYVGSPPTLDSKVAAVRYLANGELDPTFGSAGIFTRQLGADSDQAATVDLAEGGKLLLAGDYIDPVSGERAPAVLRLDPGGALDPAFGAGGVVLRGQTARFGEAVDAAAVDSQDRLVTIGTAYHGDTTSVAVTRYLGDPRPEPANRTPHARMKKVPRKVAAARLKGFSGTASDPDGDGLRNVQIALVRLVQGGAKASRRAAPKCFTLKNRRARFKQVRVRKGKRCPQRWLAVNGKAKWRFPLKRSLPPGRYVVYARAVDAEGLAEATFSRQAGNRYAFRVRASS
jgi:uncharacterized delta-60 repeat protein